ncbi:MAG TPA: GH3 auxin-responsive promoter family protein [Candidatus Didemnitutus sp.]|jgi:hypothetical protein
MTLAPRFLISLWAGWRVARFARRLPASGGAVVAQKAAFRHLVQQISGTELGRQQSIEAAMDYESFRLGQPLVEQQHYESFVQRMAAGEENVIWPGRCRFFVETAGSATGRPRRLPVTDDLLAHYRAGIGAALLHYATRARHPGVFLGRHLHAGASTALQEEKGSFIGNFDGITALSLSSWAESNLHAPPATLAQLPDGPEKAVAIADHMRGEDVTLLGGTPSALRMLADAVRARGSRGKVRLTSIQALWPNLECFLHTGEPLGLLGAELRALLGPQANFHEVYAAAEGWFAIQDGDAARGLRLFAEGGIFFEFLPMREYRDDLPPYLGRRCVPLAEVKAGVDYALVVTTPAGLVRYLVGDVVRFLSVDPPRLQFVGRTRLHLSTFGEQVSERELTEALLAVCEQHEWVAVNFHVAPFFTKPVPAPRGGHEWWIELRPGTVKTPTGPFLAQELDRVLAERNPDYAARRNARGLEAPGVRLVMPGVFDQWTRGQQAGAVSSRIPCCRPDRLIADQLAALTRFHNASTASPVLVR